MVLRMSVAFVLAAVLVRQDSKAAQLMAQARQAIGGEARLSKIQALSATGGSMRMMPDGGHVGELKLDLQLPNRWLRTDSSRGLGSDAIFVMLRGLDGTKLLRNSKILNGGPGHRMSNPPILGGTEALAVQSHSREMVRLSLALLLTAPAEAALKFAYGGEAESPDGKADLIDVTGANGFAARLFLDKSSHKPMMLTFRDFDPRVFVVSRTGPPGLATSEETTVKDLAWFLEEYKPVGGVQLPHRISRAVNAETEEEWTFKTFTFNPVFAAGAFSDQ